MKPLRLRDITGVTPAFGGGAPLDAATTALLLIDYQQEYRAGPLALPNEAAASANARRLRESAGACGIAVIHVLHQAPAGSPLFAEGTPGAQPINGLTPAPGEAVVYKRLPSAFAGTNLAELLAGKGVTSLLIAGFMTHNCVDATAREAFHRGYRVAVAADACATRDLPGPDGRSVSAAAVHASVLAGLGDRMAEIIDTAGVLALFRPPSAN